MTSTTWTYARGQYELLVLDRLVREGHAANRFVHYAMNYGRVRSWVEFRRRLAPGGGTLQLAVAGRAEVLVDGSPVSPSGGAGGRLVVGVAPGSSVIHVIVRSDEGLPGAVAVVDDGWAFASGSVWQAKFADDDPWQATLDRVGTGTKPPHTSREPTVRLRPRLADGLYTLDDPVLGRPVITSARRPLVVTGESPAEARYEGPGETRHEVVPLADGTWTTKFDLGFRHVAVSEATVDELVIEARRHPVARRGSFTSSDRRLDEIWAASARTLHACMDGLMLDGIKRDRMPWMGDQALNTLSNAYAFGDGVIVRDGIVALGQVRHGYVNGIADYSLWWLINGCAYQRYFGDGEHLRREADTTAGFLDYLAVYLDDRGVFRPSTQADGFADAAAGSVFIDWGVSIDPQRVFTPLQILWFWAIDSGATLLHAAGHPDAHRWRSRADATAALLRDEAWDPVGGGWSEYFGERRTSAPHAAIFAMLSGLSTSAVELDSVRAVLLAADRVGTPFMTSFALRALALAGERGEAVARIRRLWGEMLDMGSRTFWEEFVTPGEDDHAMYGRPFGKSLCHAWSAGPAALLPEIVLGIRPLSDGWREVCVEPDLGALAWASAVVPLPGGDLVVRADGAGLHVEVPGGSTLVVGERRWVGPSTYDSRALTAVTAARSAVPHP